MGKTSIKRVSLGASGRAPKQKRSDFHFTGPDGSKWDSRFEYLFYTAAKDAIPGIFRCTKSNTFSFILPIKGGVCGACESASVGQRRTLTPDFCFVSTNPQCQDQYHYIETKGFLRAKERSLLRALGKAHPDISLSIVLQRSYPIGTKRADGTKSSIVDWFTKFLPQVRVYVWNGKVPEGLIRDLAGRPLRAEESETVKLLRKRARKSDKRTATAAS